MVQHDPKHILQLQLETLFNKNQTGKRIRHEFTHCKEFDFHGYMAAIGIDEEFGFDLLVQMALHKRCNLQTLVGILRHHFNNLQSCADAILLAAEHDLVDWSPQLEIFIVKYTMSEDVQREIDIYQYPLPMVVEPKSIKDNKTSGYLLSDCSVILKNNHHEDDVVLDHLDRMNRVKFSINENTVNMVRNEWRNLDKPKQGETKADYEKRVKAFNKYDQSSREVIKKLIASGNEIYLTHRYDKRGRIYAQGYHVNYQGNTWSKAIVELADKELVI